MRWVALAAFLAFGPGNAIAQDWATRDYCDAPARPVVEADFAPHDLSDLEAKAADIRNGTGRLWEIRSPDGAVSHLWGTFHVSAPEVLDLPKDVQTHIASARLVALELDFTFPDRDSFLFQYDLPGRYRDPGDPFAAQDELDLSFLGPEAEGWVYDRLYGYGTFDDALFVLTYAGLAEILLSDPCEDLTGGALPVQDDYIHTLAHIAGADVVGLEDPGEFLTDLAGDDETAKAIITVYASYLEPQPTPDARVAAFQLYVEGRLGLLSVWDRAHLEKTFGANGVDALEKTNTYLVDRRNRRFLDRVQKELETGGVFLAVGAAHVPGDNGLVAMLRRKGFTVTRVSLPGEVK